ncbi:unnamed protein product [Acanthoscelides obtectus]|uniref:Uncharacterized protein n=1 Tax=Acanthoscelides obtectus TaxID=200917 RepID=A0A9P0LQL8_ACAOB|nr:unnamed protein product [Acanthoscelides obtectus]CAK1671564.1 hypothetical protein AOBTE_LOCUS28320 [Acanthoscelides obtectus]
MNGYEASKTAISKKDYKQPTNQSTLLQKLCPLKKYAKTFKTVAHQKTTTCLPVTRNHNNSAQKRYKCTYTYSAL